MPGRRWYGGHGHGDEDGGGRQPRQIRGFVEPALLLLLLRRAGHGYELMAGLSAVGFADYPVDLSTVYRALAVLEREGAVTSTRENTLTLGPPRRVYEITTAGEEYLRQWVAELRFTDSVLHRFLECYDQATQAGDD
ncbi:MAG: PadR family transcriptional regulator [Anaerolineae bacterium]